MKIIQEITMNHDFVHTLDSHNQKIIALTEQRHLLQYKIDQNGSISLRGGQKYEHSLYDVKIIPNTQQYVLSCKNMPLRVCSSNQINCIASISDHKQNSELYLSPIRMDLKNYSIIGGGRKFLREYSLQKYTKIGEFKQFDKCMISEVKCGEDNILIVGDFLGRISMVDYRSRTVISSINGIHQDAIMDIKIHPYQSAWFASRARRDNFIYVWDTRNLSSFLEAYEHPTQTNQRMEIQFQSQKTMLAGTEKGSIKTYQSSSKETFIDQTQVGNKTVNCIKKVLDSIIITEGERNYEGNSEAKITVLKK